RQSTAFVKRGLWVQIPPSALVQVLCRTRVSVPLGGREGGLQVGVIRSVPDWSEATSSRLSWEGIAFTGTELAHRLAVIEAGALPGWAAGKVLNRSRVRRRRTVRRPRSCGSGRRSSLVERTWHVN